MSDVCAFFCFHFVFFGMCCHFAGRLVVCLISEGEHRVKEEQHSVDDGQRALGDGQSPTLSLEAAFPSLQDQHTGGDEHGTAQQAEEQIDLLVDGVAQQVTSKEANQNDAVANEGTSNEHNRQLIGFSQTFVVQYHTTDGEGQFQKLDDRQPTDGHFWRFFVPVAFTKMCKYHQ